MKKELKLLLKDLENLEDIKAINLYSIDDEFYALVYNLDNDQLLDIYVYEEEENIWFIDDCLDYLDIVSQIIFEDIKPIDKFENS